MVQDLAIEPHGKLLKPKFRPSTLKYSAVLPNATEKLKLDTFCDEADATLSIPGDLGGREVSP